MQSVVNFQVKLKTDKVGLDLHTAHYTETLHGELKHNNMGPFTNHINYGSRTDGMYKVNVLKCFMHILRVSCLNKKSVTIKV